jgi:putative sigma-54 modulation protein
MRFELTGRHVEITPALRRLVDSKLAKLGRLLNDSAVSAQAVLTQEKYRHRAEITLHARGEKFLHGVGNSNTWDVSVTEAVEKLTQQAQKVKGKWQERKRRGRRSEQVQAELLEPAESIEPRARAARPATVPRMPRILRASRQTVRTISVADAARLVDQDGDGVVVFRDTETAEIAVLYRRANGELMLLQTEM